MTPASSPASLVLRSAKPRLSSLPAGLPSPVELISALQQGDISFDQAKEIAAAEESSPGAATELLEVAKKESFHVLKD